jgi:type VI secretion system secreted protein Hcp
MPTGDYFLKIDGIKGNATDQKHKEEIDILSFTWGVSQAGSAIGPGHGAGKAQFQSIHFTAQVNKSSPMLVQSCATGAHIKEAVLVCRRAGGKQEEYLVFKFTDLLISSYQISGNAHGDSIPVDSFAINYDKCEMQHQTQDAKGVIANPVKTMYDLKQQMK